jgi:hypothetical protein
LNYFIENIFIIDIQFIVDWVVYRIILIYIVFDISSIFELI